MKEQSQAYKKKFVKKQAAKKGKTSSKSKAKKKEAEESGASLAMGFCWLIVFSFCLWLLAVMFMQSGGSFGAKVSFFFRDSLGYSAYVFPFILLYCLAAILINIKKDHVGLFTMTSGLAMLMASLCGFMARMSMTFGDPKTGGSLVGGRLGYIIDNTLSSFIGGFGSTLVSLIFFFAGVQLLFKIPWMDLVCSFVNLIKEDYQIWAEGRRELKEKLRIASERESKELAYSGGISPVKESRLSGKNIYSSEDEEEDNSGKKEKNAKKTPRYLDNSPSKIVRNDEIQARNFEMVQNPGNTAEEQKKLARPVQDIQEDKPAEDKQFFGKGFFSFGKKKEEEPEERIEKPAEKKKPAPAPSKKKQPQKAKPGTKVMDPYYENFKLPGTDLLDMPKPGSMTLPPEDETMEAKLTLENTFKSFGIDVHVTEIHPGPVVTRYEVSPGVGVKITSITSLAQDVALAMRAGGAVRVTGQIPGKAAIGFEIPNKTRATVTLRELLESAMFKYSKDPLTVALGRYAEGSVAVANLEKMPHLLIAGATASGKSVFMQSLILSLMFRNRPDEVKFLFIDPKRMELTFYEDIPYLYDPKCSPDQVNVITDPDDAAKSLQGMVQIMYDRTKKFSQARAKNMASYNKWALENGEPQEYRIVVVVDELADLMIQQKKVVEDAIQRLAQMARAVGIHLVLATQRPSTDVITGVIKANLPSRVALKVTTATDSRVILDQVGANSLLGYGDLLYLAPDKAVPARIQGAFVSEDEIKRVADFVKEQARPNYEPMRSEEDTSPSSGKGSSSAEIMQAIKLVLARKRISQDLLKAHFGSSARATNILSILECDGFIKKPEGSNKWAINFDKMEAHLKAYGNKSNNMNDDSDDGGVEELIP